MTSLSRYLFSGIIALIFIITANSLFAQQQDFRGKFALGVQKKVSKSFSFSIYNENIFSQNLSELGYSFFDGGINYKINKNFSLGGNYRFTLLRTLDNYYDEGQMVYGDVAYAKSIKRFSFALRARIQDSFHPVIIGDTKQNSVLYNRDKLTLKYRINYYLIPFVSGELYVPINHPTHELPDRFKSTFGIYYNINDYLKIAVDYAITQEMNQTNKKSIYTLGASVYYEL